MAKAVKNKELSYNSAGQRVIGGLRKPSIADAVIYFIAGALFISAINYRDVWSVINNSVQTKVVDTSALIDDKLAGVGDRINHLLDGRVGQMIFWAIVGCFIYMLIWLIQNTLINLRNDVVADQYLHPKSYKRSGYWEGVIAQKIFFVALVVSFFIYIFLSYSVFVPILSQIFYVTIFGFEVPGSILLLSLVFLLSAIMIYTFVLLTKLLINSYQTIVNNF
jgi:hypothetical protein